MDDKISYCFKRLTLENILEPDPVNSYFGGISESGEILPATVEERVMRIIEPQLKDSVPIEVKKLFEVARGAIAYGWYFYPLYTLGCEQLFRVIEAAVKAKCMELNLSDNTNGRFHNELKKLHDHSIVNYDIVWQSIRKLRNSSSHPNSQTILPPGAAIGEINIVTKLINSLF